MSANGNDKFDALIASTMRGTQENLRADCPDADVLAAYASRSLDAAELPRWDDHVAGCALCQGALAALVRADAVGPAIEAQPLAATAAESEAARASFVADEDQGPHGEGETILGSIRRGFRFILGPFPLSVTLHVIVLLFLIITVHEQRGRELIMVNLEAGGGGGGGSEMQDLDMPEVPMPDTAPQIGRASCRERV